MYICIYKRVMTIVFILAIVVKKLTQDTRVWNVGIVDYKGARIHFVYTYVLHVFLREINLFYFIFYTEKSMCGDILIRLILGRVVNRCKKKLVKFAYRLTVFWIHGKSWEGSNSWTWYYRCCCQKYILYFRTESWRKCSKPGRENSLSAMLCLHVGRNIS